MSFSNQNIFSNSSNYYFSSKNDLFSNTNLSPIVNKNKNNYFETNQPKDEANLFQAESYDSKKSINKKSYQDSISAAQNRVLLTKLKLELSSIKKQFGNDFQSFHLFLNNKRQQILREAFNRVSLNNFSNSNLISTNNSNSIEQIQIRENKILKLKQKIAELKEQNEMLQSTRNNIMSISFEEQIKEKDQYIQSIENEYKEKLAQMDSKFQEQKRKFKSLKDQNFIILQLQTQVDDQNKEIDQLKTENLNINQKLEKQIKQNAIASDDIEYTVNKIEQYKKEIKEFNQENSKLKSQIDVLNQELQISKENNVKISNENKRLKDEINQKEEKIMDSLDSKNILINQIKEKNEIIDKVQNEISILNAEKSLNQSVSTNTATSINDVELYCLKYNSKEYKKLQNKVICLNSQIESQKVQIEEQNNLIQALRTNLQQNKNEIAIINQNSQKDKSDIVKKETQTLSLKNEIIRLENVINQKEQFIAKMLDIDSKRAAELDRLHLDLEEARNNIKNNENQISDHLSKQFREISNELKIYRSKANKLDLIVKQQKYQIQEIQQENDDLKNRLNFSMQKNVFFCEEKDNLQEKFKALSLTYTTNASKMQKVIEFIKNQNLEVSKENSIYIKKNLELQEALNLKVKMVDQLSIENSQLKKENSDLIEKINFEYIPLKNDNNQLKKSIEDIRNHEKVLTKENQSLVVQIESLKKEKETQKSIDDRKMTEKQSQLDQIEDEHYENQRELEKCQTIIQSLLKILNVDSIFSIVDTVKKNEKEFLTAKSKLSKISNEKKKIESINKLQKIKIKSQETQINKNNEKIADLENKLKESKMQADSLNSIVNQSKENFKILQKSFSQIQNQMEDSFNANLSLSIANSDKQYDFNGKLPFKSP